MSQSQYQLPSQKHSLRDRLSAKSHCMCITVAEKEMLLIYHFIDQEIEA